MRRLVTIPSIILAVAALAAGCLMPGAAGAAPASTPYCGITWGSLPKSDPKMTYSPITNVRSGQHTCYDRLVVDLAGPATGFNVSYVPVVTQEGSGEPLPLAGGAFLQVVVRAPGYDIFGHPTYIPVDRMHLTNVAGYRTFRQVAWAGSFEAITSIGLGVRARLPMRVFTLAGPGSGSRVVIDVAHQWSA
jgi:hypothetical protein